MSISRHTFLRPKMPKIFLYQDKIPKRAAGRLFELKTGLIVPNQLFLPFLIWQHCRLMEHVSMQKSRGDRRTTFKHRLPARIGGTEPCGNPTLSIYFLLWVWCKSAFANLFFNNIFLLFFSVGIYLLKNWSLTLKASCFDDISFWKKKNAV